jgi:hypothetical protein
MIRGGKIGERTGQSVECYGIVDVPDKKDGNGAYLASAKMPAEPHTFAC